MSNCGPIYGVELLDSLPLDGGMRQALPSADDLRRVKAVSARTAAGYEVLLEHYRRAIAEVNVLRGKLFSCGSVCANERQGSCRGFKAAGEET